MYKNIDTAPDVVGNYIKYTDTTDSSLFQPQPGQRQCRSKNLSRLLCK